MDWSRRTFLKVVSGLAGAVVGGLIARAARARARVPLRPPGALSEEDFLARCIRCQQCVNACPTDVLQVAPPSTGLSMGTPYIVAREIPCDLCMGRDQMRCIPACPTDALKPLTHRQDVRMGVAVIDDTTCLPFVGVSCKACWHACPYAKQAIGFDPLGRPHVVDEGCVGCGLCVRACLTEPTSIQVVPFGGRRSSVS